MNRFNRKNNNNNIASMMILLVSLWISSAFFCVSAVGNNNNNLKTFHQKSPTKTNTRSNRILQQEQRQIADLLEARTKWNEVIASLVNDNQPIHYSYGYSDEENYQDQMIVVIENGNLTSVRPFYSFSSHTDDAAAPSTSTTENYHTIDGLFDMLESYIVNSNNNDDVVMIEYDPNLGHPTKFEILNAAEDGTVDVISKRIDPMTFYTLLQKNLDTNKQLWKSSNVLNYDYVSEVMCFCMPTLTSPKKISIRDGEISSILDTSTEEYIFGGASGGSSSSSSSLEEVKRNYIPMEELFDDIQHGIDNRYHKIDAQYDSQYGYPSKYGYDYEAAIADDEQIVWISEFVSLDDDDEGTTTANNNSDGLVATSIADGQEDGGILSITDLSESSAASSASSSSESATYVTSPPQSSTATTTKEINDGDTSSNSADNDQSKTIDDKVNEEEEELLSSPSAAASAFTKLIQTRIASQLMIYTASFSCFYLIAMATENLLI